MLGGFSQGAAVMGYVTAAAIPAGYTLPPIAIGALYAAKTIQQCIPDDPVCSLDGSNPAARGQYLASGMVDQAADLVARRL